MGKCVLCQQEAKTENKNMIYVEVFCPSCGHYVYEKTFLTTLEFFLSSQNQKNSQRILQQMKKIVAKAPTCFVDDFETTKMDDYNLCELSDIIHPLGIEFTHNNTIDSNYKD